MARTLDQVLAGLAALKPSDFDNEAEGVNMLYDLTDDLMKLPQPERAVPALFALIEKMPNTEMGNPGPIVHTLEQMRGYYERELAESIKRHPTVQTVWMLNRILNGTSNNQQREVYISLLRCAAEHPAATESVKQVAQKFISYQTNFYR